MGGEQTRLDHMTRPSEKPATEAENKTDGQGAGKRRRPKSAESVAARQERKAPSGSPTEQREGELDQVRDVAPRTDELAGVGAVMSLGDLAFYDEDLEDPEPTKRRLSFPRILAGVVMTAGTLAAAGYGVRGVISNLGPVKPTFFAPYVDATLTPAYQFQSPIYNSASQVALGFVVASSPTSCNASWGGYYSVTGANQYLDLARRVKQYTQSGGQIIVSFGGKTGTPLEVACRSSSALAAQYQSVLSTYPSQGMDLDIEGAVMSDAAAIDRNAKAVAQVEASFAAAHKRFNLWLTIPATLNGLDGNGKAVVAAFLRDHVSITGVNLMTMDFGQPVANMGDAVVGSLQAAHTQLQTLFRQYGNSLSAKATWNHMGATVMIGQNDSAGESFSLADARTLTAFADSSKIRRISFWSLNRDTGCGAVFGQLAIISNTCSGTSAASLGFSKVFAQLNGRIYPASGPEAPAILAIQGSTNPANAPYPMWSPTIPYPQGYKVVWEGNVFVARYFTQGTTPSASVQYAWQNPWLLVGPVLSTDHAPTTTTLPPGAYPAWNPKTTYNQGNIVDFNGLPYQARFYNVGVSPAGQAQDPTASPWTPLFNIPGEPSTALG
ncbi:MAG: chitinase [Actinomycetota bacterium]|nr:chitinase [Actinomycetota bacterium]